VQLIIISRAREIRPFLATKHCESKSFSFLQNHVFPKDPRCLSKCSTVLEILLENCEFQDLVVKAKLLLSQCLVARNEHISVALDLLMSCTEDHYGLLPEILNCIMTILQRSDFQHLGFEMFETWKDLYTKARNSVVNKTCDGGMPKKLISLAIAFFNGFPTSHFCELVSTSSESVEMIRKILPEAFEKSDPNFWYYHAELCCMENNFQDALVHLEQFQEFLTTTYGHGSPDSLINCYARKTDCYIALGKKKKAKKCLNKLKLLKQNSGSKLSCLLDGITKYKQQIEEMPDDEPNTDEEPDQKIRSKVQCNSYHCDKVETYLGEFKCCQRCRLKYYCSRKCQKDHWYDGHKKECKKYKSKKK
jgi:tetratricopeptide (TPR) repeat protein